MAAVPRPREVLSAFAKHDLFTYANALAFRVLVSLVPLTLLGLALLGELGLEDVWDESIGPAIASRVTLPVFAGIDFTVQQIFRKEGIGLIAFAAGLALWHVSRGMRIAMNALNAIHDKPETRSRERLVVTDVGLAAVVGTCVIAASLLVATLPRLASGLAAVVLELASLALAAALLGLAIALVMRYAPAERPEAAWASAGSVLVVVTWLVSSIALGWWAGSVANYKSAVGTLTAFLLLTTYVLLSTSIFLAGALLDELARKARRR